MQSRESLATGALLGVISLGWIALAVLPGRIAIGQHQAQYGRSPLEFTIAGTLRDVSDLALPLGAALAVALTVTFLVAWARRQRRERSIRRTTFRAITVLLGLVGAAVWFASSSAAEFKIQRGVEPTRLDVEVGVHSVSLGVGTLLRFLALRRHWVPTVMVFAFALAAARLVRRRAVRWPMHRPAFVLSGFVAAIGLGWGAALVPLDPHVRVFRTLSDRHVVGEPFVNLVASFGRSKGNVRLGLKSMIEQATYPPQKERAGEALLGLPDYPTASSDCRIHPMARSLPARGHEDPRPGARGHHGLEPVPTRVLELLDELSAELHEGRSTPIDAWQVMLESFRGDDIHAISPPAPRELAPFMGSLYEAAERGDGSVIAFKRMWQAGARTSQGFSSYMCGMGMMPYGLSVTRDFGPIPLRCVTDVLVDASAQVSFLFGGPPSFDEMDTFLRDHGVRDIVGRLHLPATLPTSEGGVSDRALVAQAAAHMAKEPSDRAHYVLLMTSSNHVPYGRPEDVPADIDARVDALTSSPEFAGAKDDAARLRTFAYTDRAVQELFDAIGPRLERTLFVIGADHATSDPFVWRTTPEWNRHAGQGLIPFVIVLPEPLIAKSARPDRVRELVRAVGKALEREPWSQNDVPLLLLTLLAHAPGMKALPASARWHTLGGERTSPFFAPPKDGVKVIGIDCVAELYGTDAQDGWLLPPETSSFVQSPSDLYTSSPSLIPIAATFSRFLNGYAATCRPNVEAAR